MGKIKLDLTKPMLEYDGIRTIKKVDQVQDPYTEKGQPKSTEQMRNEAPDFLFGDGLARHLMFFIQPKDTKELVILNKLARRIANAMANPGFIELAPTEIHDLITYLERMQLTPGAQHMTGDLIAWLQDSMNA